jgi:hypothetical protein
MQMLNTNAFRLQISGSDQETEFQEIEIGVCQEIETLIRKSKVVFLSFKPKLLSNDQEIEKALGVRGGHYFMVFL